MNPNFFSLYTICYLSSLVFRLSSAYVIYDLRRRKVNTLR